MRAATHDRYGGPEVLHVEEVAKPEPADDEVRVEVHASSVTRTDTGLRSAEYWFARAFTGLRRPKRRIAGMEFAGVIEAIGASVTTFDVGEAVFGIKSGANAEYLCVQERGVLAPMPADMTFEEAAAVADGALTAMAFLRQAALRPDQRVLVYGATGSIGTAALQLARHLGAEVTAACEAEHADLASSLGATTVVDYRLVDVTSDERRYHVILDAVGELSAWQARRALEPGGVYLTAGSAGSVLPVLVLWLVTRWIGTRRVRLGVAEYRNEDIVTLTGLIDRGAYRAVVDRSYPLEDVVEAHGYVDTHRKIGNVVLVVRGEAAP
jgi:NADPH:quinone reductase-like Zn-dependent oxidoreductase